MLTRDDIEAILKYDSETRGVEVKGAYPRTDSHMLAKVARAALSMGNLRDGGHVIIGIADDKLAEMTPGLEGDNLASWLNYDDIARSLAVYADPPLRFDLAQIELSNGAHIAVLQVHEFAELPHFCAKAHDRAELKKGALYVRSRAVPETAAVASSAELREVVKLATEKALRAYVESAERAGVELSTAAQAQEAQDEERFAAERSRVWDE